MKIVLYSLLSIVLLVVAAGVSVYLYLRPAPEAERIPAAVTQRSLPQGDLVGFAPTDNVHAWLGIPFAAAPVDTLRWRAPRAPQAWSGQREATTFGPMCPQSAPGPEATYQGDEDCLYLNIWAPAQTADDSERFPVMFWIHGGGNSVGSASTSLYDGTRWAEEHKVVLVSIQYRLGPFGWFSHPALRGALDTPADRSGNFGTLDTIAALHWTQNHIALFGGDPDNVTIFGESAGAFDVLALMASPLADGLFHRAISQSGGLRLTSIAAAENYVDDALPGRRLSSGEVVNTLLQLDGSASDRASAKLRQDDMSAGALRDYLYSKSPEEMFAAYQRDGGGFGMLGNPDLFADGHVLPAETDERKVFSDRATYNAVPIILGTNRDETKLFTAFGSPNVKRSFGFLPTGFTDADAYDRNNYYGTIAWKERAVDGLATVMRQAQGPSVFAYRFDADDWRDGLIDVKRLLGAAHAMEIPFVFGNFPRPFRAVLADSSRTAVNELSDSMRSYWAEFAYSGDPGRGRDGTQLHWGAWENGDTATPRLMLLDTTLDAGIRMTSTLVTRATIKAELLADQRLDNESFCDGYRRMFQGADFDSKEYHSRGECPAVVD